MSTESRDSREMWWTVALEATLFVSLPALVFSSDRSSPANHPFVFALTVLAGASVATALCHLAPAFWARGHHLPTPVAICVAAGAASSFEWVILFQGIGLFFVVAIGG